MVYIPTHSHSNLNSLFLLCISLFFHSSQSLPIPSNYHKDGMPDGLYPNPFSFQSQFPFLLCISLFFLFLAIITYSDSPIKDGMPHGLYPNPFQSQSILINIPLSLLVIYSIHLFMYPPPLQPRSGVAMVAVGRTHGTAHPPPHTTA